MIEIKAPKLISDFLVKTQKKIFLAGTIDNNLSVDWQSKVVEELEDTNYVILNPRRESWDSSWKQDENNKNLNIQVNWEIDMMDISEIIVMYFAPNSKSPITLFEYGKYIESGKIKLCCPDGYFRKGNVDIYAKRYGVESFDTLESLINNLKKNA